MSDPIDFYFDFSSPYGYFGAEKIEDLAAGFDRQVIWHPILLGAVFKESGAKPLLEYPLKGDYMRHDLQRLSTFMDVPFKMPDPFPIAAVAASRAFYALTDQQPDLAKKVARELYRAYFAHGLDISKPDVVLDIALAQGADRQTLETNMTSDAVKQRLRDENAAAIGRGVFGSPFFIADGEPIWGADRFWMLKRWLKNKSWK